MAVSLPTSPTLLDGLREHDQRTWERFARLYAPLVYQWGRKSGLQPEDMADVTQEVFRVVLKKLDQFDANRKTTGAFRSWLYGITRIAILDHVRTQARQAVGTGGTDAQMQWQEFLDRQLPAGDESAEGEHALAADRTLLRQVIKLLRDEFAESSWQAFWQSAVAGRPAREIGKELGLSTAAVRQAKYRILRRLRDELAGLD